MRKFLLLMPLLLCGIISLAQLHPGTIAFVEANFDNPDDWAIMTFNEIPSGTTINFTDNGWLSSQAFRNNEGTLEYITTQIVPAGSVINFTTTTADFGTISPLTGTFALSGSGDQIFAFTGTVASPNLLAAIHSEGTGWQSDATSSNTSSEPTIFAGTDFAVVIPETDNMAYNGVVTTGTGEEIRAALANPANWTTSNTAAQSYNGGNFVLPVEFIKFTAKKFNNENVLSWATATEINNEKFMVERSTDGSRFYNLGSVKGQGTSAVINEYSFVDYTPLAGMNYYRLKQMDFDGNFEYSTIVTVDNREDETIKVYPTTLSDYLTIEANENAEVKIFSVTGKLILNQSMNNTKSVINLSELATGSYFVAITTGTNTVTKQVIKK